MSGLVDYDSSDSSDDEKDTGSTTAACVGASKVSDLSRATRDGLPSLIFVEVPSALASSPAFAALRAGYEKLVVSALTSRGYELLSLKQLPLPDQWVETPLHLSLSRYFELEAKDCDRFIERLRRAVAGTGPITVSFEACQTFASGEKTKRAAGSEDEGKEEGAKKQHQQRVFLGMLLGLGREEILRLTTTGVDPVMTGAGFLPYYQPTPEPHCSFLAADVNLAAPNANNSAPAKREEKQEDAEDDKDAKAPAAKRRKLEEDEDEGVGEEETREEEKKREKAAASAWGAPLLPSVATGDLAFSPADITPSLSSSFSLSSFAVDHICARIGKRLFRLPLGGDVAVGYVNSINNIKASSGNSSLGKK